MDNQLQSWLPLESNSEVINKYLIQLGCSELLNFFEIVSFDEETLQLVPQPCLGALFIYPDKKEIKQNYKDLYAKQDKESISPKLYYMKQNADNACGTVAILHQLLNLVENNRFLFREDSFVLNFYRETAGMTQEQRADHLRTSKSLHQLHSKAVHQGATHVAQGMKVRHHFIGFSYVDGCVYELDGRKDGPINWGKYDESLFLEKVSQICMENFIAHAPNELGFNLMALCLEQ